MKKCLLCEKEENGNRQPDPDAAFICSKCLPVLASSDVDELARQYNKAVDERRYAMAYALDSFVPRGVRRKFRYKEK